MPSPAERGICTAVEERNYASSNQQTAVHVHHLVSGAYHPRLQEHSAHGGDNVRLEVLTLVLRVLPMLRRAPAGVLYVFNHLRSVSLSTEWTVSSCSYCFTTSSCE